MEIDDNMFTSSYYTTENFFSKNVAKIMLHFSHHHTVIGMSQSFALLQHVKESGGALAYAKISAVKT